MFSSSPANAESRVVRIPPVLLYHQIASTTPTEDALRLAVPPETFESQIKFLHGKGYRSVTLDAIANIFPVSSPVKERVVAITFDDGYLNNYMNAFPILQKYGFTATIFFPTAFVGKANLWDSGSTPLMTWAHARQMADCGISFQSHSSTHADLISLSDDDALCELVGSKKMIEDELDIPVWHFSYPFGRYDERIKRLVEKAGYRWAWAAGIAERKRFSMERFQISLKDTGFPFLLKVSRWGEIIRRVRQFRF